MRSRSSHVCQRGKAEKSCVSCVSFSKHDTEMIAMCKYCNISKENMTNSFVVLNNHVKKYSKSMMEKKLISQNHIRSRWITSMPLRNICKHESIG